MCSSVNSLISFFAEYWFTQIIELLHVPLQSLYTYKQRLEECKKNGSEEKKQAQQQQKPEIMSKNKITENGHTKPSTHAAN